MGISFQKYNTRCDFCEEASCPTDFSKFKIWRDKKNCKWVEIRPCYNKSEGPGFELEKSFLLFSSICKQVDMLYKAWRLKLNLFQWIICMQCIGNHALMDVLLLSKDCCGSAQTFLAARPMVPNIWMGVICEQWRPDFLSIESSDGSEPLTTAKASTTSFFYAIWQWHYSQFFIRMAKILWGWK